MMDEHLRDNVERLLRGKADSPVPDFMARMDSLLRPPGPPEGKNGFLQFLRLATAASAALCVALLFASSNSRRILPEEMAVAKPSPRREILAYMSEAVVGSLVAQDEEGRPVGELGLKSHEVRVEILDGVAKTTVEENFQNHTDRRLEGTFHFPLPPDASISRLALEVNGKIEEGTCLEREKAREVFESIVRKMKDPALLEWMPGGIFKCRIFPIEPRATKRVIIAYTQALPFFQGKMTYVYPLVSEKTKTHPPEELRIDVLARFSGELRKFESPSHRVDISRRDAKEAAMTLQTRNARPESDFVVTLETADDELRVVPHKADGDDGYFSLLLTPRGVPERKPGKYVFVLDTSASVTGPELEVEKRLVRAMIENRIPGDRFEILSQNVEVASSGEVDLRAANDFMDRFHPGGGSDVLGALHAAPEGEIVYIGKGTPTWGETDSAKILEAVKGRQIRTIGVGSKANVDFLQKLGGHFRVSPSDDVHKRVSEIAATLGSPVLSDIRVAGGDAIYDVVGVRDIFYGERLVVTGRYRGQTAKLVVTGRGYHREIEVTLPPKEDGNNYVRRLWAQRKVADLLAQGEANKGEVTELGVKHQIMTPYTSFLVLENEQMWKDYQLKREVQKQDEVMGRLSGSELENFVSGRLNDALSKGLDQVAVEAAALSKLVARRGGEDRVKLEELIEKMKSVAMSQFGGRQKVLPTPSADQVEKRLREYAAPRTPAPVVPSQALAKPRIGAQAMELLVQRGLRKTEGMTAEDRAAQIEALRKFIDEHRHPQIETDYRKAREVVEAAGQTKQYQEVAGPRPSPEMVARKLNELRESLDDVGVDIINRANAELLGLDFKGNAKTRENVTRREGERDWGVLPPRVRESILSGSGLEFTLGEVKPTPGINDPTGQIGRGLTVGNDGSLYYTPLGEMESGRPTVTFDIGGLDFPGVDVSLSERGGDFFYRKWKHLEGHITGQHNDLAEMHRNIDRYVFNLDEREPEGAPAPATSAGITGVFNNSGSMGAPVPPGPRNKEGAALELYDARDILLRLSDFTGPRVELVAPSKAGGGPQTGATFTLDPPEGSPPGLRAIVELIKQNVASGTWQGDQTIEVTPSQQLLVNASPPVRQEVSRFLARLRDDPNHAKALWKAHVIPYPEVLASTETPNAVVLSAGAKAGLAKGHFLAITRDGKFVAILLITEVSDDRARCGVYRGLAVGSVLRGDRAERISGLSAYLTRLPVEVRLELASRANQGAIRAKMGLRE